MVCHRRRQLSCI